MVQKAALGAFLEATKFDARRDHFCKKKVNPAPLTFSLLFLFLSQTLSTHHSLLSLLRVSQATTTHQTLGACGPYPPPPFAPFWCVLVDVIPLMPILCALNSLLSLALQALHDSVCRSHQAYCAARLGQVPSLPSHRTTSYFCVVTPLFCLFSGRFQLEPFCVRFCLPPENDQNQVYIVSSPSCFHLSCVPLM